MTTMNRREALALLLSAPVVSHPTFAGAHPAFAGGRPAFADAPGANARAQTRATAKHRVVLNSAHGLLIAPDGSVHVWHRGGFNGVEAILGLGPQGALPPQTLATVPALTGIVAAAAGVACSFAVRADGTLLTWGVNSGNGKLGTTSLAFFQERASWGPNANAPVPLAVPFDAVDVSTMNDHVLALTRDGRVYAWGTGDKGQLGIGPMPVITFRYESPSAYPYTPFPIEIAGLSGVTAISAGYAHSLAVMEDGTVRAWGENRWGEVGDGTTSMRHGPVVVPGVKGAVGVAAGQGFSAAVLGDGTVMTWGNRIHGALGRAHATDNRADPVPALVPGVTSIRTIVAGHSHVLALTAAGTVISWGMPDFGQLGRAGASNAAPGAIPGLAGVQSIAAHNDTSMAVLASGRIMTWGGHLRPWTRPPEEGSYDNISHRPILLWLDGLDQP